MSYKIIDGKLIAQKIKDEIKKEIADKKLTPGLAVVLVGDNPASQVYARNKKKACEYVGIESYTFELPASTNENELLDLVNDLNLNERINGILVQLPLPDHINELKIIEAIIPEKDVDGFHPINVGNLLLGRAGLVSCTPAGILELLKQSKIDIAGKHCVVVGRSNIVGKPAAQLMLNENATVTICHSQTKDLPDFTQQADILIAAVGKAKLITKDMIKIGAVVIDVGMNRNEAGKLCGDTDFDNIKDLCSYITPVPGGVGPMTIAMLMKNCLKANLNQS